MRRTPLILLAVVVLGAAGFAAASIASGARLLDVLTGTTGTATATTATTPATGTGRRVTVCHPTRSKKHPAVTITVSQHAVRAVLRGGGHLGRCTGSEKRRETLRRERLKRARPADGGRRDGSGETTTSTTDFRPIPSDGQGEGHGNDSSPGRAGANGPRHGSDNGSGRSGGGGRAH